MKVKKLILFFVFSLLLIPAGYSQTDNGHLFTMTMIDIPLSSMDEFLKSYETDFKQIDAQNEYLLSFKVFTHQWGPEWKVCFVAEYKDWEGFLAANKKWNEIFEKTYPDKSKRDELNKKFGDFLNHHTDAIVMDHPNLQK